MNYLFKRDKDIEELQSFIIQNNDIEAGKRKLQEQIKTYYIYLDLETDDQAAAKWWRAPKPLYYVKIVSSFISSIFRKNPKYVLSLTDEEISNIDLLGNSLNEFVPQILYEVLKQGFGATIVDYSEKLNKPFLVFIKPESFVSIKVTNDNGYPELTRFIYTIFEEIQSESNEFEVDVMKIHYVWDINENGQVRVRKYERQDVEPEISVYERNKDITEQSDILVDTQLMMINGKPLTKLPIIIHGRYTNNFTVEKSVLQDVSDLNIDLFNRIVDQVEVLHLTAMPTPYILGADASDPDTPTTIGSSKLWVIGDTEAKVGLIEFSGKSSQAHRDYIEDVKEMMATSGAQILRKQGVSRETATSVLIRTNQETAIITSIVENTSSQITEIMKLYSEWSGKSKTQIKEVEYQLNSDFISTDMEPNAQIALVRSWLDGAISHKSMFKKMKQGELIDSDKSFEDELKDIASYPPKFPGKEKDAENAENLAELNAELAPEPEPKADLKGSNMETGNAVKNTEAK